MDNIISALFRMGIMLAAYFVLGNSHLIKDAIPCKSDCDPQCAAACAEMVNSGEGQCFPKRIYTNPFCLDGHTANEKSKVCVCCKKATAGVCTRVREEGHDVHAHDCLMVFNFNIWKNVFIMGLPCEDDYRVSEL